MQLRSTAKLSHKMCRIKLRVLSDLLRLPTQTRCSHSTVKDRLLR